jgi:hypothetical protein
MWGRDLLVILAMLAKLMIGKRELWNVTGLG